MPCTATSRSSPPPPPCGAEPETMLGRRAERSYACWHRMCAGFVTKVRSAGVRALVVTNMWPSPAAPQRGIFVYEQVAALRRRGDVEIEVFAFPPGPRALLRAIATIRRATGGEGRATGRK